MAEGRYYSLADRLGLMFVRLYCSLYERLGLIVTREISAYLGIGAMVPVWKYVHDLITVYNLEGSSWSFSSPQKFGRSTVYCLCSSAEMLCVCASSNPRAAALVNLFTAHVTEVCDMADGRCRPGVVRFHESVYVFGGDISGRLRSCEKFAIAERQWARCAELPTYKFAFTPSVYKEEIYMLESQLTRQLEIYIPAADKYRTIKMRERVVASLYFIVDAELFLVSKDAVCSAKVDCLSAHTQVCAYRKGDSALTNSAPLLIGNSVYWASYAGDLMRFDLASREVIESDSLL